MEAIHVSCGNIQGLLHASRFGPGCRSQCIEYDNKWLTPNEFEDIAGKGKNKHWKRNIFTTDGGKTLKKLIDDGVLRKCPPKCGCTLCRRPRKATRRSSTHENNVPDKDLSTPGPIPKKIKNAPVKIPARKLLTTQPVNPLQELVNDEIVPHTSCTSDKCNCLLCMTPVKKTSILILSQEEKKNSAPNSFPSMAPLGLLKVADVFDPSAMSPPLPKVTETTRPVIQEKVQPEPATVPPQESVPSGPVLDYVSMVQEAVASLLMSQSTLDGCSKLHILLYILNKFRPSEDIETILVKMRKAIAFLLRMGVLNKTILTDGDEEPNAVAAEDSDLEVDLPPKPAGEPSADKKVPEEKLKKKKKKLVEKVDKASSKQSVENIVGVSMVDKNADGSQGPAVSTEVRTVGRLRKLSPLLSEIVGGATTMHTYDIVKRVWVYVRSNNLQNPKNKALIMCDEKLRKLCRRKKVRKPDLIQAIGRHCKNIKK